MSKRIQAFAHFRGCWKSLHLERVMEVKVKGTLAVLWRLTAPQEIRTQAASIVLFLQEGLTFILIGFILFIRSSVFISSMYVPSYLDYSVYNYKINGRFLNVFLFLIVFTFRKRSPLCWWCVLPLSCMGTWNWCTGEGCVS